jgi:hypothetical protein
LVEGRLEVFPDISKIRVGRVSRLRAIVCIFDH